MPRTRTGLRVVVLLLFSSMLALCMFVARTAAGHAVGLSTGEYTARGSMLGAKMAFARNEVAQLAPMLDRNGDGHITAAEVTDGKPLLVAKILDRIRVTQVGAECKVGLDDAGLTEQDGMLLGAHWSCSAADKPFTVEMLLLDDLARGHRHVARAVSGENVQDEVLFGDQRTLTVDPAPNGPATETDAPDGQVKKNSSDPHPSFGSFFLMGIEHILTGYDHLVFIFGLLLVRARLRSLLAIITAFTVAHSVTLAVATLGIWTPSPRIVEPAIALSIAYVGVDNLLAQRRKDGQQTAEKRWKITFPFGLVHGFGFAGALREIGLPKASIPTALVAFNIGVESGQLAVLAIVLPVVIALRKTSWFETKGVRVASIAVVVAGLVWFVTRVVSPG